MVRKRIVNNSYVRPGFLMSCLISPLSYTNYDFKVRILKLGTDPCFGLHNMAASLQVNVLFM